MAKFANVTISIGYTGDGKRRDTIFRAPLTPTTFAFVGPPGALSINSPSALQKVQLQSGYNTMTQFITSPTGYSPFYYFIMSPPTTSTNIKVLMGSTLDVGIGLVPNWPLVLALDTTNNPSTPLVILSQAAELVDVYTV